LATGDIISTKRGLGVKIEREVAADLLAAVVEQYLMLVAQKNTERGSRFFLNT
jgi:hypothetical protein